MSKSQAIDIYLSNMEIVKSRLRYSEGQLNVFKKAKNYMLLENAILHTRKALECIAYASIAPNKKAYAKFRSEAGTPADFRKDYHGGKILKQLEKINKEFYPLPLMVPKLMEPKKWHYDRLNGGYLTKNQFIKFYDRLGKYLHADNPWDNDKGYLNLAKDLPDYFSKIKALLQTHATFVQDAKSRYAFIINMGSEKKTVSVVTGIAEGEFNVRT